MDIEQREKLLLLAINASIIAGKAIMEVYASKDFGITHKADWSPLTLADRRAHDEIVKLIGPSGIPVLSEEGRKISYDERKGWKQFWIVDPLDGTKEFIKRNGEFTVNIALISDSKPVMGVIFVPAEDMLYFGADGIGAFKLQITNYELRITNKINQILEKAEKIPYEKKDDSLTVIASRSHINLNTFMFIQKLKKKYKRINIISKGSSLKLCLIAEGIADIYPRFSPTMEWDIAAGHAIINASGGKLFMKDVKEEMKYNKESLLNSSFTAYRSGVSQLL